MSWTTAIAEYQLKVGTIDGKTVVVADKTKYHNSAPLEFRYFYTILKKGGLATIHNCDGATSGLGQRSLSTKTGTQTIVDLKALGYLETDAEFLKLLGQVTPKMQDAGDLRQHFLSRIATAMAAAYPKAAPEIQEDTIIVHSDTTIPQQSGTAAGRRALASGQNAKSAGPRRRGKKGANNIWI
jgi:hypothetical protein